MYCSRPRPIRRPSSRERRATIRRGFTLVEIMIVIVIIGLLAGVVTVNVRSYLIRAKQNTARGEIASIVKALGTFYSAYDRFPTNDQGLTPLVEPTEKFPEPPLVGKLIDPWGNEYQYMSEGRGKYTVVCYGADGREGGEGIDADITSDDLKE